MPAEKRFYNSTGEPVPAEDSPGAKDNKFDGNLHYSHNDGRWDDLQQSRRDYEDDAGAGSA